MKRTAIGVVAACSSSSATAVTGSSSSIPTAIVSRSGGVYKEHHNRKQHTTQNVVKSIRGGSSAPASSTTETSVEEEDELDAKDIAKENAEKKKRKKKKYKKKQTTNNKKTNASSPQQSTKKKQSTTEEDSIDQSSASESSTNKNNSNSSPLSPEAQSILKETCHYNILGITKSATQSQIQKAYRKRCIITHPDKVSGDRSAFDKVSVAYDILSCEKKRAVYDKFGQRGIDQGLDVHSDGVRGFGMGMGNGQFGTDVFRDFFSGTGIDPFNFAGRRHQQQQHQSATRRNRDLRYQLEVTLEELYNGTTKHVLIQQPNGSSYYQHHRKEVEVTLPKCMSNGQSVRLSGVVDSIKDAPPADVIFIIRERRHPIFTRRVNDLAIEVRITSAESIVGYKRSLKCLNGKEIVICNPVATEIVKVDELVDAPSLPKLQEEEAVSTLVDEDDNVNKNSTNSTAVTSNNTTAATAQDITIEQVETSPAPEQMTKTTTTSYKLPPSIIQTGDVHVLEGYGMPIKGYQGHDSDEYGNLYIQYRVESPLSSTSSSSTTKKSNLSPQERVDLARLLNKLEGNTDDIAKDVISSDDDRDETTLEEENVHHLVTAKVSDFGRTTDSSVNNHGDDDHLRHDEEDYNMPHGFRSSEDVSDFVHRAFAGRTGPFGGTSFGFSTFTSSSSGGGYGYNGHGEEEDHKVECNQM